eukprot:CAMPEP_0181315972 /NCGR_PEP_ID=MMETSP1101-20121128/15651_1 /TAXON_ID=46948 /ORGANISM="Rhodomonas abbreviata, Strain Caron Lab Isolate" /LENGTH=148 /DNA_ID=CAMNT_0023423197 /DNA_START=15 /DNA_END=461 /DNA_ORIENTATION=-
MSGQCTPDLLWMLTRANNAFLVKRDSGRTQFCKEQFNLTNTNSFKTSGIANGQGADLQPIDNGAVLTIKSSKGKFKPAQLCKATKMARGADMFDKDFAKVAKCVKNTVGGYYRPDLSKAALARWTKLHRSIKKTKKLAAAGDAAKGKK